MTRPARQRREQPYDRHAHGTCGEAGQGGPIVTGMPRARVLEAGELAEAPAGGPDRIRPFGFAVGTLVIAIPLAGLASMKAGIMAALAPVLALAGLAQLTGSLVTQRKGSTFTGTTFCAYGANSILIAAYFPIISADLAFRRPPAMVISSAFQRRALPLISGA